MSKRSLVKAYSIPDNFENELIEDYMRILKAILDDLWKNIAWKKRGKRLIPFLRKDTFRKELRDRYLELSLYSKHYVDSAIKQAYSMLESWRKRYLSGRAERRKPELKRRGNSLELRKHFTVTETVLRILVRPYEESITIDLRIIWCWNSIKGSP